MNAMNSTLPMPRARALGLAIALAVGSAPLLAQEMDHSKMHMPAPKPAPAAQKKPAAKKPAATQPAARPAAAKKPAVDPHAGHAMPKPAPRPAATEKQAVDPHAGHAEPKPAPRPVPAKTPVVDPHAGHAKPKPAAAVVPKPTTVDHSAMGHDLPTSEPDMQAEPMDHSGMDHDAMDHSTMDHSSMDQGAMDHSAMGHTMGNDLPANAPPREPIPSVTPADRAAAFPEVAGHTVHDNSIHWFALLDRLETWDADEGNALAWEAIGWVGTDLDRLWIRSEGESTGDGTEADIEVLYGRAIARWWDAVVGIRHDFGEGPSQTFAGIGVIGMAPYKFEVEATAYIGEGGQTAARVEVEYDTLLTNKLILQWLAEAEVYGKDDPRRGIGSGLSKVEAGLRLRYEFTRRFAPYIGIVRERAFGSTADFRRGEGHDIDDTRFVAGVRLWF